MSEALADISPSFVVTLPANVVAAPSIEVDLASFEETYPANAASLAVSTLLIKETISANVSVSAVAADKIASILPFSV